METARTLHLLLALCALSGCAGDGTPDATLWRYRDGRALSEVELAQSRADCRQATIGQDRYLSPFAINNPAYHPGGIGLKTTSPPGGFAFSSTLPNVSSATSDAPERIEACLYSKGIVRAP